MMLCKPTLIGTAVFLSALCAAIPSNHAIHEERHSPSKTWEKLDRVASDAILPVRIGLTQSNLENGYDYLMDVSDPNSRNYGKHWTSEEVIAKFAPSEATLKAVRTWLESSGISLDRVVHHDNKGWLSFNARADELENLVQAQYYEYQHTNQGRVAVGCDRYHIPAYVQPHIDYIVPGVKLSAPLKKRLIRQKRCVGHCMKSYEPIAENAAEDATDVTNCDKSMTPACIRALYEIPLPGDEQPQPNNTYGLFEIDKFAQGDLNRFFKKYSTHIPIGTSPIVKSVDGGHARAPLKKAGFEADFDIQLAYPILYPTNIIIYQVDDHYYNTHYTLHTGVFNTWLDAMDGSYCNSTAFGETGDDPIDPKYPDPHKGGFKGHRQCGVYKPTKVISISFGVQEDDLPGYYQKRQCDEFMKLGLQGTSIFVASGDSGVGGIDGHGGCLGPKNKIFNPTQPNSCYAVTNVGGTEIARGNTVKDPEIAAKRGYYSSGGFSNIFLRPDYQAKAIDTYFRYHAPPYRSYTQFGLNHFDHRDGRFNRLGRGIPDISAVGGPLPGYFRGKLRVGYGTSGSSPIAAAIFTRINNERLKSGKSVVGFVNPVLYQFADQMLNDITNGSNPGCGTPGFKAVKGWDPVTGLGTPSYPRMLKVFLGLP